MLHTQKKELRWKILQRRVRYANETWRMGTERRARFSHKVRRRPLQPTAPHKTLTTSFLVVRFLLWYVGTTQLNTRLRFFFQLAFLPFFYLSSPPSTYESTSIRRSFASPFLPSCRKSYSPSTSFFIHQDFVRWLSSPTIINRLLSSSCINVNGPGARNLCFMCACVRVFRFCTRWRGAWGCGVCVWDARTYVRTA